jgi:hypothetical protein
MITNLKLNHEVIIYMIDPEIVSLVSLVVSLITGIHMLVEKCLPEDPKSCRSKC